jgi:hypothetical protein
VNQSLQSTAGGNFQVHNEVFSELNLAVIQAGQPQAPIVVVVTVEIDHGLLVVQRVKERKVCEKSGHPCFSTGENKKSASKKSGSKKSEEKSQKKKVRRKKSQKSQDTHTFPIPFYMAQTSLSTGSLFHLLSPSPGF